MALNEAINAVLANADLKARLGGQSGIGRDLGRTAIENYTEQKVVWLQTRP